MNYLPVRPLMKYSSGDGAWYIAQKAEQRKQFKAIICALKSQNEDKDKKNTNSKIITDHKSNLFCKDLILDTSKTVDPDKVAVIRVDLFQLYPSSEDFSEFISVYKIQATSNNLNFNCFTSFCSLTELYLSLNGIKNILIDPQDFVNLQILDVSFNELTSEDVLMLGLLRNLKTLSLCGNSINQLPAQLNEKYTDDDGKELTRFNELIELNLENNNLCLEETFSSLGGLTKLKILKLANNRLSSIPLLRANFVKGEETSEIMYQLYPYNDTDNNEDVEQMPDFFLDNSKVERRIPSTLHEVDEESIVSKKGPKSIKSSVISSDRDHDFKSWIKEEDDDINYISEKDEETDGKEVINVSTEVPVDKDIDINESVIVERLDRQGSEAVNMNEVTNQKNEEESKAVENDDPIDEDPVFDNEEKALLNQNIEAIDDEDGQITGNNDDNRNEMEMENNDIFPQETIDHKVVTEVIGSEKMIEYDVEANVADIPKKEAYLEIEEAPIDGSPQYDHISDVISVDMTRSSSKLEDQYHPDLKSEKGDSLITGNTDIIADDGADTLFVSENTQLFNAGSVEQGDCPEDLKINSDNVTTAMPRRYSGYVVEIHKSLTQHTLTDAIKLIVKESLDRQSFKPFPALEELDLSHNRIKDEKGIISVISWINLKHLSIHNNPLTLSKSQKSSFVKEMLENSFKITVDWLPPIPKEKLRTIVPKSKIDVSDTIPNLPQTTFKPLSPLTDLKSTEEENKIELPKLLPVADIINEVRNNDEKYSLLRYQKPEQEQQKLLSELELELLQNDEVEVKYQSKPYIIKALKHLLDHPVTYFDRRVDLFQKQGQMVSKNKPIREKEILQGNTRELPEYILQQQYNRPVQTEVSLEKILNPAYYTGNRTREKEFLVATKAINQMQRKYNQIRQDSLNKM